MNIKEYVANKKEEIKLEIAKLIRKPSLVIIQANDNPASDSYIRGKIKDANELGITPKLIKLDPSTSEESLLLLIKSLNTDDSVDGFIVQLPLPKHISEDKVKLAIAHKKDVDGFHPLSQMSPCTPKGIIEYLKANKETIEGKNAVVIGRSNIVGKPMAKLLLKENANVTILHSKTKLDDMKRFIELADIIVIAIGKTNFLNDNFKYKKEAIIIDVGINKDEEGLHGDAKNDLLVRLQTPVPGGVGLLTRLALMENVLEAYKNGISNK
ncbi:MAG: bifunctional 5,10-methylenetetrahydrofolate dehydrogenase/5,10-methenyltetrahydrofolate cyclohydrolase [Erysipelotrichaceae bacterium]|jgi:methylenetetrahydrofolate dehydrogenase (NADP+)/methenyltetrahydrofolate cyclohydrolase|nr:bifunctional 5,10-methylenetetrahydrofolate dehydrogenase/5,10-methenyltetrahydrofolate cyclohydrolase [Erysipelotrichaceae bacterium]